MGARKEAETRKWIRWTSYEETLAESLTSMFIRTGLPEEDFRRCQGLIEEILLQNGCGAYLFDSKKDNRWVFGSCDLGGSPDAYGFGTKAIVTLQNGATYQFDNWRDNPDIVVAFNTPIRVPDINIPRYAEMLMEVETSLISQLLNSRCHPVPVATDKKMVQQIEEALADIDAGKLRTILSPNVIKDFLEMGVDVREIPILNITDPNLSDHIQYISKLRDDLLRWFWSMYGHSLESNGKLAQQTVEEVSSGQSISKIIPMTRYMERQIEAAELKRKFGWNVTIDFSDAWKQSFARQEASEEVNADDVRDNEGEAVDDSDEAGGTADEV